eukprot:2277430-Pyramimonas_sp.AAC.1
MGPTVGSQHTLQAPSGGIHGTLSPRSAISPTSTAAQRAFQRSHARISSQSSTFLLPPASSSFAASL